MNQVVPSRFLFRYVFTVPHVTVKSETTPLPLSLDNALSFSTLKLAWNEAGLGLNLQLTGRQQAPRCDPGSPETSDGLFLWIDTRNTQTIHRAGRFCHTFCFLPTGGGPEGSEAVALPRAIGRAREEPPPPPPEALAAHSHVTDDGYQLDAWLGSSALHGWEIDSGSSTGVAARLGFYWSVHDSEQGDQVLSIPDEFPFAHDPSLWATLELLHP